MKQVLQSYRTGTLSVEEVPAPGLAPGALLVLTHASLVSPGTDRTTLSLGKKSLLGKARERPDLVRKVLERLSRDGFFATSRAVWSKLDQPVPLGYSCAGVVVGLGEGVEGFALGDRVACAGAKAASHAELNLVPQSLCAQIPEGVDDETAAFVALGAVALHGLRQARPTLGETFAVIGLGLVGQLTAQLLRANGCAVLGIDLDPRKVELLRALGAEGAALRAGALEEARRLTSGRGVDGVLICAGTASNDPVQLAGELCRDRGRVVAVGAVGMEVPRRPWYDKELQLLQSRSYGPGRYDEDYEERGLDYPLGYVRWTEGRNLSAFLAVCQRGLVRTAPLVSHRFPIARAEEAYAALGAADDPARPPVLGIVLTYPAGKLPERTVQVAAARPREGALRLGVLGAGSFAGGTLLPLLAASGARLVSIASARGMSARHFAEKFGVERASTDSDALLQDPGVDAVVIATRHAQHAAQASAALVAGKHVYLEKPPALDESELLGLLAAARASGRILMPGYNRRFAPLLIALKRHFAGRKSPLVLDVRVNAGPLPDDHWVRREGGRLIGEACHFVDLCVFVCDALPERVFAQATRGQADEDLLLSLRLADGSIASVRYVASGDVSAGKERVEVMGDGAHAVLEDFRTLELRRGGKKTARRGLAQDKGHQGALLAFLAAAKRDGASPIPLGQLAAVSRATFAAQDSLRTGEAIAVPQDSPRTGEASPVPQEG